MPQRTICGVYKITAPSGSFYIGSSLDVHARWSGHKSELRKGRHHCQPLQRAASKYGLDALTFTLLAECPAADLRELEQLCIDMAGPVYNASRSTHEALSGLWQQTEFRAAAVQRASDQIRALWQDPKFRQRQRDGAGRALAELHKDPEFAEAHKQRATARLQALVNTPEGKAKAAEARRQMYANDPEARRLRSERAREQMLKLHADPAYKARMAEAARERMRNMRSDPTARARNSAAIRAAHGKAVQCVETGQVFATISDAAQWCGLKAGGHITAVLNGRRARAGGYTWRLPADGQQGA